MTGAARFTLELAGALSALLGALAVGAVTMASSGHRAALADGNAATDGAQPLRAHADRIASYTLSAQLDAAQHVIRSRGHIRWRNASRVAVSELYLHLYLNAFESERTLFYRSPFGAARNSARPARWGSIEIKRLVAQELGQVDLWPLAERHTAHDPEDRTDIRIPLPVPVEPDRELTLAVEFEARLPTLVERTGFRDGFHFVAQWYPKLARLEPDGTWRHYPFHPQAEFSADFGRYDVTLDVPEAMRVGATGVRTHERVENGRRLVRHEAEDVHDFAWTAWDGFQERSETVDGTRVILLHAPDRGQNAMRSLALVRQALPLLGRRYGRYPYPVLTVVDPPRMAAYAGGMEYPTLITTGGPWWAGYLTREVEVVTVHELAHQWFYGMVATDEAAWPFLDEGLASYAEGVTLRDLFGAGSILDGAGLTLSDQEVRRVVAQSAARDDVVAQPADRFASFTAVGELAYARTATALVTLGNVYGAERCDRALGRYAREQRFLHPGPETLLSYVRQDLGSAAEQSLRAVLFERGTVDYRARSLTSLDQTAQEAATPATRAPGEVTRARPNHAARVLVVRAGALKLPVEIDLIDALGKRERRWWDGQSNWTWVGYSGSQPLTRAVVDPDRKIGLDETFSNNATANEPDLPLRILERFTYFAQLGAGGWLP